MQPTKEPLDHPTDFPQPATVFPLPPPELRLDASPPHLLAVRVTVVGAVPEQFVGPPSRPAGLPSDLRDGIHDLLQLGDVGGVGRAQGGRQWDAVGVHHGVVLAPFLAAIYRTGAGLLAAAPSADKRTIHGRPRPVDLVRSLQLRQQDRMEAMPDACAIPVLKPAATATAGATAHLARQVVPADARLQDEEDAGQGLAVGQRLAAGIAVAAWLGRWEQGLDPLPEGVGQQWRGHDETSSGAVPQDRRCECYALKPSFRHRFLGKVSQRVAEEVHVVVEWLGNSPKTALAHYTQVTEEHHQRAADSVAPALQKQVQQPAEASRTVSQDSLQVLVACESTRDGARQGDLK